MFAVKRAANLFCPFYFWEKIMIVLVVCVPAESSWHPPLWLVCGFPSKGRPVPNSEAVPVH